MDSKELSPPETLVSNFCPKCGQRVDDEDSFCRGCGADLRIRNESVTERAPQLSSSRPSEQPARQDNSMAIAGAAIFFMGFLVCLWMIPLGLPILAGGLALWIIGAARRDRK